MHVLKLDSEKTLLGGDKYQQHRPLNPASNSDLYGRSEGCIKIRFKTTELLLQQRTRKYSKNSRVIMFSETMTDVS